MRIDASILRRYREIHTWTGLVTGLLLFIAFYAGALTMFQEPLARWARPASALPAAPPVDRTDALLQRVLDAHPEAAAELLLHLGDARDIPARITWPARDGEGAMAASFDAQGGLAVQHLHPPAIAGFIDDLHQKVGLPFDRALTDPVMGTAALLYALALVSGVVVLLPSLVKDLFALRLGRNLKRLWLDAHNALGLLSLPFHGVMALTSVVFAFHMQIYDAQGDLFWEGGRQGMFVAREAVPPPPGAAPLPPTELLRRLQAAMPGAVLHTLEYERGTGGPGDAVQVMAMVRDPRHFSSGALTDFAPVDAYSGALLQSTDAPGRRAGFAAATSSFFALHFGSFGGLPVRWTYFLLGLAGAFLFYTGNLLWIEARRVSRRRGRESPRQRLSASRMAAGTVGVCLGCMAGISACVAVCRWLPASTTEQEFWLRGLYYVVFLGAVAWAWLRGAARAAVELLWCAAIATLMIPAATVLAWAGALPAVRADDSWPVPAVEIAATLAAAFLAWLALVVRRRVRHGPADSVWSASPPDA